VGREKKAATAKSGENALLSIMFPGILTETGSQHVVRWGEDYLNEKVKGSPNTVKGGGQMDLRPLHGFKVSCSLRKGIRF